MNKIKFLPGVEAVVVLDFETYYSKTYTLSKLTTEEYVRDPRFEVIGVSLTQFDLAGNSISDTSWVIGDAVAGMLATIDWNKTCVVAHNMAFDGFILSQIYDIVPQQYACTLNMSRPWFGLEVGGSLKAIAARLGFGEKGTEVEDALGKHLSDFHPNELEQYGAYCRNDVLLCSRIFWHILNNYPCEMPVIDMHQRMGNDPVLDIDVELLKTELENLRIGRLELLRKALLDASARSKKVADRIMELARKGEAATKLLSSNPMFKNIIGALGYECPTKTSPTTGKEIPALGKKDPEFLEFQEATVDDACMQTLIAARQRVKSTLMESRVERFIGIRERGAFPIPLTYWGAFTGRTSGRDKVNLQNMPRGSSLRMAMRAPEKHTLVVGCG